ncbi:photoreceptor cilium actin regulator [Synchiropus picturatus]
MGCSPSKGNNFVTMNPHRKTRMLPPPSSSQPKDQQKDVFPGEENHGGVKATDVVIQEKPPLLQKETQKIPISLDGVSQKMNSTALPQTQETNVDKQEATEKKTGRKTKKNTRGTKGVKRKDKDKAAEQKVDFPEQLVKAHQAAYAFLNPNINKYDAVLELLEQGTQTQESLQPMVAFMALSYEQTILMLEEIADEGEKVMKEHGDHLAWPSPKTISSSSSKSSSVGDQPPPDLLQQLLQYTTQRMRNVSQTVGGLGDSALEEAAEYFSSVAQLLEEKRKVKRAAETRLMQLLTRIEMASLRKPGPEDCALFSEDSGIGGESESVAGSERRLRRESCGSSGTNRTTPICPRGPSSINIRRRVPHQISPSDSLSSLNSLGSTGTVMGHERKEHFLASVCLSNDGLDETEEGLKTGRVRFRKQNLLLNRESQQPKNITMKHIDNPRHVTIKMKNTVGGKINFATPSNSTGKAALTSSPNITRRRWSDEKEQTHNRPQTAAPVRRAAVKTTPTAIERRSRSAESLRAKSEDPTLMELERTQKNLSQRLQKINKGKGVSNTKSALSQPKKAQSPKVTPKRQTSGKRNNPISPQDQGGLSQSGIQIQESSTDVDETHEEEKKTIHFLVRATPPPSPPPSPKPSTGFQRGRNSVKRLIDSFSQGIEDHDGANIERLKGVRKCGVPVLPGLGNVEAALSAKNCVKLESASSVDLDSLPPPPLEVLMDNSFESAENLMGGEGEDARGTKSPVVKRAAMLRLRTSVQSVLPSRGSFPQGSKGLTRPIQRVIPSNPTATEPGDQATQTHPPVLQQSNLHTGNSIGSQSDESTYDEESSATIKDLQDGGKPSVPLPPYSLASSQPPPTVSKGRMLPSTPSTPRISNRRLPSPHNLRRQATPPSTASPPAYRQPPSPTETQRVLRSPQTVQKSFSSYAFKAPSPPASPKVQRREKSIDDSARSFNNARSVFCPASPTLFEAPPCPRPPQAWTGSRVSFLSQAWEGRGRSLVSLHGPRPFVRRSQSDRRPSLTSPRSSRVSVAETCGSEPSISTQGLDDDPTTEDEFWGSQSDLSVTTRSASQPDLCVVGRAFHRD